MINLDRLIIVLDRGIRTTYAPAQAMRKNPAAKITESSLNDDQRKLSSALMRVNHSGEICAQALYQGQALTARSKTTQHSLEQAAQEETDHLAWTEQRITELGGRKSLFNPFWFTGSFIIGALAGLSGDKWSLGFLAETEQQVEKHLGNHLNTLPISDSKSRAILAQMKWDEGQHATTAIAHGAKVLPFPIKWLMRVSSKIMTKTTYWI
jgi:3-demethoxyubiquinol 3-hydroxylase